RERARGKSIRAIARDLRLSRDTVTKYLRSGETEAKYERHCQPYPQLGPIWKSCWSAMGASLRGIGWTSGSYSRRFGGPAMPAAMTRCAVTLGAGQIFGRRRRRLRPARHLFR